MNKILLSVFFAFSISIAFFYIFQENFPPQKVSDVEDHDFFNEQLGTNSKKFLMLGGSGTAQLNSTMIDNLLKNNDENFAFYNLAYNADTPKLRYQSIHQTFIYLLCCGCLLFYIFYFSPLFPFSLCGGFTANT